MRDSVLFYRSFWEAIRELDPEGQAKLLKAILEYGLDGIEPEINGVERALFCLMRPQIDANNRRYENGRGGGRPKAKPKRNQEISEADPNQNQTETKPEPNQNQVGTKAKAKEKEKVKEKVKVKEKENTSAPGDKSPCAGSFALNDGTEFEVTENDVITYQQLYPAVDVRQELRNIKAWCLSNPTKRKTRSGAKRFFNAWLSREQNGAKGLISQAKPTNRFHNFDQRDTDYDALLMQEEKELYGGGK
jgi:hypothetical protein|nr:MAG TPA: hypothetical protein [Caudoviricetes sp.]